MMLLETEIKACAELVARCERDLGQRPLRSHRVDLICDNREWPYEKCAEMIASLWSTHGVGAFHMAEARNAFPMKESTK